MNNIISNLLLYGDLPEDSILMELSDIFATFNSKKYDEDKLRTKIYHQMKRILDISRFEDESLISGVGKICSDCKQKKLIFIYITFYN